MDLDKFVGRVENMLFEICGCDALQAEIILKECLKRLKEGHRYKEDKARMEKVEKWAKFVCEHDDSVWSEMQANLINSQLESARQIKLTREQVDYIKQK